MIMNNNNDHLFQLIQSMTKNEKRYFRLEVARYESAEKNDYLRLYDAIERQSNYDETAVKETLGDDRLIKRFASIKNYLYNILVQSLTNYHAESNSRMTLHGLFQQIDMLFSRGLYKQSNKLLQKAKKIAADYQRSHFTFLFAEWDKKFANLEERFWKLEKRIQAIYDSERQQAQEFLQRVELEDLHLRIIHEMYSKGHPRDEAAKQVYLDFLKHPALQQDYSQFNWRAQNIYCSAMGICYHMLGDRQQSLFYDARRIELLEQEPQLLKEENLDYSIALYNYIQELSDEKRYDEAFALMDRVRKFTQSSDFMPDGRSKEFFFLVLYYHSTRIYLRLGDFDKICALNSELKQIFEELLENPGMNGLFFMIPLNMSVNYLILGNYDESLYWIRIILNDKSNNIRHDILGFVRILHLIIQYELKNYSILDYYIESTHRYLQEHDKLQAFEQLMLRFIKKLLAQPDFGVRETGIFQTTKNELIELTNNDSYARQAVSAFYLLSWFDSKLTKRTYLEWVREQIAASY